MTTNYHTVIATGAAANASTFNAPLGQLDAQLTTTQAEITAARDAYASLDARLDGFTLAGSNVSTLTNGAASAGQKVVTVDSTTGFLAGAPVAYTLVGGAIEANTVGTVNSPTQLTLTTNIGTGGIANDTYIAVTPLGSLLTTGGTMTGDLETTERVTLLTTGALVEAPWVIDQYQINPQAHDNVFAINYNVKRLDNGTNSRVETGEHCILFNIEARFHPTDPIANRGQLEWYLRIDPALTGTPSFTVMPFSLAYNFDLENCQVQFGDSAEAGNSFLFYGGSGGYLAVFGAPMYIRGATSTDRLTLAMTSSADAAQISSYDELAGTGLRLTVDAGGYILTNVATLGGEAYHRFDVNGTRKMVINAAGVGVGTTFPASALDIDAGALTMKEMSAPGTPAANSVVIYAVDNGSGKTKLMALFPTGVAQQLAIEP